MSFNVKKKKKIVYLGIQQVYPYTISYFAALSVVTVMLNDRKVLGKKKSQKLQGGGGSIKSKRGGRFNFVL